MIMNMLCQITSAGLVLGVVAIGGGALTPTGSDRQATADRGTAPSRADDPEGDLGKIQGEWIRISTDGVKAAKVVKLVVKRTPSRPGGEAPGEIAAFSFEWKTEGEEGVSRTRALLGPTGTPKTLDFFPVGEAVPKLRPGIYKLEGDTLTVCFRAIEGDRPKAFIAGRRNETLDVYRRANP